MAWTVSKKSCMVSDVVVRLSKTMPTKYTITFEVLVSNAQTRLSQALLSYNMFSKTRQKGNVEDLSRLSHGVLYTQIMFIQDVLFFIRVFFQRH